MGAVLLWYNRVIIMKDGSLQIKLINQALAAAQASIELSKSLLADLSGAPLPRAINTAPSSSQPGITGTYDGENMVTASGEKFPVPPNYASKTLLVYGDKLKMIEAGSGDPRKLFKQIERVTRQKVTGLLSKKGADWLLVTSDGSYKVLEASVNYYGFKEGDHQVGLLPADNLRAPFAALEGPEKPPSVKVTSPGPVVPAAPETSKPAKKLKAIRVKKIKKVSKKVE